MNYIFIFGMIVSIIILSIANPNIILPSIISGGANALSLSLKMCSIYVFWLGILKMVENLKLSEKLSKLLKPITRFLLGDIDKEAEDLINLNIATNILGVGNAATPLGIEAVKKLNATDTATKATVMFFVMNATSLQVIPTTVISLRASFGSLSSYDILLPTFIVSLVTTIFGVILVKAWVK